MSCHVLIEGGKVCNVVMPGPGYRPPNGNTLIESETANIGDEYDGKQFVAVDRPISKEELNKYVHLLRDEAFKKIDFNFAEPGDEQKIINISIPAALREEIRDLAWLAEITGEDTILVVGDDVLTLSPKQLAKLRRRIADYIHHSHAVAAKLIDGIERALITSLSEIDKPETATALKVAPWRKSYA